MEQQEWIVINYTLPREPSRIRVAVWRKLKKIGAVNIQQSMWMLPWAEEHYNLLNEIKDEIFQNSGEAFVMRSSVDEDGKKAIIERFNHAREEEYQEFLEKCEDFIKEIEKEQARQNYTFAEIEENEEELRKLREWLLKISGRDFFGAPSKEQTKTELSECESLLENFCNRVYERNDMA